MRQTYLCVILPVLLSSCASMPDFENQSPQALTQVAHQVDCELKLAFSKIAPRSEFNFDNWRVSYKITDNSRRDNGISVSPFRWIVPAAVDELVFNADFSIDKYAERTATADFSYDIISLRKMDCADAPETSRRRRELRVSEWISAINMTKPAAESFGYIAEFNTEFLGGAGLGIQDGRASGTGNLSAKKTLRHTVYLAFAKKTPDSGPQEVYVVNFPEKEISRRATSRGISPSSGNDTLPRRLDNGSSGAVYQNQQTIQQLQLEQIRPIR